VVNFVAYNDFSTYSGKGLGTELEQARNNNKHTTIKKETTKPAPHIDSLWEVWLSEFSPKGPHPTLTPKRKKLLTALYDEQLSKLDNPKLVFQNILKAVRASPHHMGTRAYHLPCSLFRNFERRENWTHRGLARVTQQPSTVSRNWSIDA
jgi:hypothetical protein